MSAILPDECLMLAACLEECDRLSTARPATDGAAPSGLLDRLLTLTPACAAIDPRTLTAFCREKTSADPRRAILTQAAQIAGPQPVPEVLDLPLDSVWNQVELGSSGIASPLAYQPARWSVQDDTVFPRSRDTVTAKGAAHLTEFCDRWLAFAQQAETLAALHAGTLSLIDELLWCIPAHPHAPDLPLSEYVRLKSAVAVCLRQRSQAEGSLPAQEFRVVAGDLSGIQKYVFGITEKGGSESGTGKRLRARSLFVQLLAEVGMLKALRVYGLAACHVLMASGGKFHILWPNLPDAEARLEELRRDAEAWLLTELHGAIGLNLSSTPVGSGELRGGFGTVIQRVEADLFEQKHRPFRTQLQTPDGWQADAFLRPDTFPFEVCPSCQTFPRAKPGGYCAQCERDKDIGTQWGHRPEWIALYDNPPEGLRHARPVLGMTARVLAQISEISGQPDMLLQLGGPVDVESAATHYPALWRPPAPYVVQHTDFSKLANSGSGRPLLGYLKADADHLGTVFQWGLSRDPGQESYDTPARFAAISRHLDRFFSGWLSHFLANSYRDSYTVFAGGDDLFLVGHWETMLAGVQDIEQQFRRFVGQHPDITLSAGIAMVKERYPLAHAAREAERHLEHAKQRSALERRDGSNRNQIALLGDLLTWTAFKQVRDDLALLESARPHAAFLYALRRYAAMWRQFKTPTGYQLLDASFQGFQKQNIPQQVIEQLRSLHNTPFQKRDDLLAHMKQKIGADAYHQYYQDFLPHIQPVHNTGQLRLQPYLAYNVARNIKAHTPIRKWAEGLIQLVITQETIYQQLDHLGTIAQLALFQRQGGEEHGNKAR